MHSTARRDRVLAALLAAVAGFAVAPAPAARAAPPAVYELAPPPAPAMDRTRALATFDEVWQTIDDTHFDPAHLETIGWAEARDELRPRAADATSNDELRFVLRELLSRLGQSHFAIIPGDAVDAIEPDAHEQAESKVPDGSAAEDGEAPGDAADAIEPDAHGHAEIEVPDGSAAEDGEAPGDEDDDGAPGSVGLDVRLVDGQVLVTSVAPGSAAAEAGVAPGWVVRRIGARDVDDLLERLPSDVDPRMRGLYVQRAVLARLEGDTSTAVTVELRDGRDRSVELSLRRAPEPGLKSKIGNLPPMICQTESRRLETPGGAAAGLIRFNIWLVPVMTPVSAGVDRFRDADGIILDLRGNPGGIGGMSMGIAGLFLDDNVKLGTMTVRDARPLNFVAFPQRVNPAGQRVTPYAGPLAIVVDGQTGSTSEIFAAGMQAVGRARVFGRTTMGAALPARMPRLPNGDVLLHAFADYVDANGVRLEGRGVVPDEPVELTRAALLAGGDPDVDAALRWLDDQARSSSGKPD